MMQVEDDYRTEPDASNAIKLIKVDQTEARDRQIDLRSDTVTLPSDEMRKAAYDVSTASSWRLSRLQSSYRKIYLRHLNWADYTYDMSLNFLEIVFHGGMNSIPSAHILQRKQQRIHVAEHARLTFQE